MNHHVSAHHALYTYNPPTHVNFMCRHCGSMDSYPVFHGSLPTYVYKYRTSDTRFGDLLSGLALYNLGRISGSYQYSKYYTQQSNEKCCLQVIDRSHFEETSVPCFMMSSFLDKTVAHGPDTFDVNSAQINVKPYLNTTGVPIVVNNDQECVIWHNTTEKQNRNTIPCALLKEYSKTLKPTGIPVYVWLPITLSIVIAISVFCQCCCKKTKHVKEEVPLNQNPVVGYCPNYN